MIVPPGYDWPSPPQPVVVRFSIQSDGALAAADVVSSSGYESLDRGAVAVVQAAAPYSPFPETFNLSTLHIVAKFEYELD